MYTCMYVYIYRVWRRSRLRSRLVRKVGITSAAFSASSLPAKIPGGYFMLMVGGK